ncbi:MAG: metal ABC transporter permease [Chloroflexi bacterium]|nr:metal ABC transporter permease [Chloroflexota bacterium]
MPAISDPLASVSRFLLEPMRFAFMQRGLLAVVLVSIICAVIGTFVVLKGMAFIGDALAHSSFAGVATAFVLGANIYLGAAIWAVLAALTIAFISRRAGVRFDTAIGIIFAGGFALGIVLISGAKNYTVDLFSFLFGNVLGVGSSDLLLIGVTSAIVIGIIGLLYKEFLFTSYDPTMAAASGLPVGLLQYLLLALLGITTVVSMKAVGIVLVVAMLVTPPAAAALLTQRFHLIMLLGAAIGVLSSIVGLYLSFYARVASGAAIVLVATFFFLLALLFAPRGLLFRRGGG